MAVRLWNILSQDHESSLAERVCDARALSLRRLSQEEPISCPYTLIDMDRAVVRIRSAIAAGEPIAIYGDYDCDGVTSVVILYSYLSSAGADVVFYIPSRHDEGYGLNCGAIDKLSHHGIKLIITVDCGIVSFRETEYAASLGMDVIITDHHQPMDSLPAAIAVVNPHRKDCTSLFKHLAGVGVVFKLITALMDGNYHKALELYGIYTAIGTVGDIVEISGENRAIIKKGLELLSQTDNIALMALITASGLGGRQITAETIAFSIVPRINAAGRLESADIAAELLLCGDSSEAERIANKLTHINNLRKELVDKITEEILAIIADDTDIIYQPFIVVWGKDWHKGVIGIVCSRLVDMFGKPTAVISVEGGQCTGSARSVQGINIYDILSGCSDILTKFGGHEMAAGFSLEENALEKLKSHIISRTKEKYNKIPQALYDIDGTVSFEEITVPEIQKLKALEPLGPGVVKPRFAIFGAVIDQLIPLSGGKHHKLKLLDENDQTAEVLYFGADSDSLLYKKGDAVDLCVTIGINEYMGECSPSIVLDDIRPAGFDQQGFAAGRERYEQIRSRGFYAETDTDNAPSREDAADVYRFIKTLPNSIDIETAYVSPRVPEIDYCKFRLALDALREIGVIEFDEPRFNITFPQLAQKADISKSKIIKQQGGSECLP
ncbi:MAG: single-stranded-DNA-specific exonuclease RecJ [Oscillospiraceae bacterium]|nr:single-stranded-DNA-specific exonuclease RecJ [Oscillospiraceae bacterium]